MKYGAEQWKSNWLPTDYKAIALPAELNQYRSATEDSNHA